MSIYLGYMWLLEKSWKWQTLPILHIWRSFKYKWIHILRPNDKEYNNSTNIIYLLIFVCFNIHAFMIFLISDF